MEDTNPGPGRPRDPDLDAAILHAARAQLAANGYDAMSVVAVAADAGTTRQAIYRRFPTKADLATAAIASLSEAETRQPTGDPFADLVTELEAFHRGVTRPNGVSMVGSMLQDATDPELQKLYRQRLVEPRRKRLRDVLERGIAAGILDPDGDLDTAVAACTGTLYAHHLTGRRLPKTWPQETATFVWRAMGG